MPFAHLWCEPAVGGRGGGGQTQKHPSQHQTSALAEHGSNHLRCRCSHGHAQTHLSPTPNHRVGHHAIDPQACQEEGRQGEGAQELEVDPLTAQRLLDDLLQRLHFGHGKSGIQLPDHGPGWSHQGLRRSRGPEGHR